MRKALYFGLIALIFIIFVSLVSFFLSSQRTIVNVPNQARIRSKHNSDSSIEAAKIRVGHAQDKLALLEEELRELQNEQEQLRNRIRSIGIGKLCKAGWNNFESISEGECFCKTTPPPEVDEALERLLNKLQNPQDCRTAPLILREFLEGGFGIGCQFNFIIRTFNGVVRTERTLLQTGKWFFVRDEEKYGYHLVCPKQNTDCFFEPMTRCNESDYDPAEVQQWRQELGKEQQGRVVMWGDWKKSNEPYLADDLPQEFLKHGKTWYWSQLYRYFLRPQKWFSEEIDQLRETLKLKGRKYLHVHVRHGAKHMENPIHQLDRYIPYLELLSQKLGTNVVFISTENNHVLAETKNYPQFEWIWTKHARSNQDLMFEVMNKPDIFRFDKTKWDLINLMLGADAIAFVLTFSSNWGRMLYHTAVGKQRRSMPVVSLDDQLGSRLTFSGNFRTHINFTSRSRSPKSTTCCTFDIYCF